jgi:hypothetical protein
MYNSTLDWKAVDGMGGTVWILYLPVSPNGLCLISWHGISCIKLF